MNAMNFRAQMRQPSKRQEGVALITALLITALVTVAAVAMASRQQLDIRRTGNMLEADQAFMYALGAEALAVQVLKKDKTENGDIDTLTDIWTFPLPPTIVEGGLIGGSIEDMQGYFNLNNLVDSKGKIDPVQIKAFQSILEQVSTAEEEIQFSPFVANRVADWIDADLNSSADGAEDMEYLNIDKIPYRTANQFMVSPSELSLILEFSREEVEALADYVVTLPETTKVNVNTAPDMVLMSLHKDMTSDIVLDLIEVREDEPFEKVTDFTGKLQNEYDIVLDVKLITVSSDFFMVTTNANIGRTQIEMYSLLNRKGNEIKLAQRALGAK